MSHPPAACSGAIALFEEILRTSVSGSLLFGYQCSNRTIFILGIFELMEVFGSTFVGSLEHLFIHL